jgi:hypothetical protein
MDIFTNPYTQTDYFDIWEMLIKRDFEGFLSQNWKLIEDDFSGDSFFGIDYSKSKNPDNWKLTFSTLEQYKQSWLKDSIDFSQISFSSSPRNILYECSKLENWDIQHDKAIVQKVFDGEIPILNGGAIQLKWRSIFMLKKIEDTWKIHGFVGYISL